jgi:hypothetical protein
MRNRRTVARSTALNIAQETRDFILHNYQKRYGIDTLLSYIYPYQFWHSRTYSKWMKRLVMEPEWVARYAKYRQFLEKSHAGLPDWWKYQLNTNELLGLDSDHPLWFNLEATLSPLYGMTGLDFSDRDRRQDWWGSTMEDLNKLGPSVWTPYQLALAVHYHNQGKEEAAAKWAGRSFTGTRFIRDATALMGFGEGKGIELDPLINFFSGGIGPWERAKVGRVLGGFLSEGRYSEADIIDAGNTQSGPIWEEAVAAAINERAPGNIASFLLGAGFKPRSERDIQIDRMYNEIHGLRSQREFLSDEEYRRGWSDMRNKYPFMDTVLLSKKSGLDRDEAYAWNVLSRIPPGATDDLAEQLGINYDDINYFYENKGDLRTMPEAQRLRFMAAVLDLSALLDMPTAATRNEWNFAKTTYKNMKTVGEGLFGDDIWDRVDAFYASEDRDSFLRSNPTVEFALDWQQETIIQTPALAAYYTSIAKIEMYLKGQMYEEAESIFGEDLWDHFEVYYRLKDANSKASRQYWKDHPQLEAYGDFKETRLPYVAERLNELGSKLPEGLPASFRQELEVPQQEITRENDREAWLASQVVSYLGGGSGVPYYQLPRFRWPEWQQVFLGDSGLSQSELEELEDIGNQLGLSAEEVLDRMELAYEGR